MKVKVAGTYYQVSLENDPRTLVGDKMMSPDWTFGTTDYRTQEIRVYDGPSHDTTAVTFMHELIHAIVAGYHLDRFRNEDGTQNEDTVDMLAVALKEVFDNLRIDVYQFIKNYDTQNKTATKATKSKAA